MSPPLFWVDEVPWGGDVTVSGSEGRHAVTVTRICAGETVLIADGRGAVARAEVLGTHGKDHLELRVRARSSVPGAQPPVTVVQALPKSERSELAVELATEAGADRIIAWQSARCVSRWHGDRAHKGLAKWRSAAAAAAKQSRRARIPEIDGVYTTIDVRALVADAVGRGGVVAVLHEDADAPFGVVSWATATEIVVVVGPEGGLADDEVADLRAVGATPVLLGPQVVRTSTAAALALAAVGVLTDRWSTPGALDDV
ncbi:16S rRNA (uracil(1498)-N(3))-methyltransferase [Williamsia sterculiae]|uniref:Ribosomal RNA small subunit methyltransferase E n=1 Tax=Williamsia sterculiae TaxID=1344003 RepID=A0A1N7G6P8_9NOCA|nr:16S rRNA (uracil(1498)-N(3))-methyltransferase [Williamsia sterculiae]SIS08241.1 16S rRNA (uracil1498-N3)-methyltransferase [Williamsia sterculiae]